VRADEKKATNETRKDLIATETALELKIQEVAVVADGWQGAEPAPCDPLTNYKRGTTMADTTTQDQSTQGQVQDQNGAADATPAKLYATKAEAEANKPTDATKNHKPYEVSKGGSVVGWLWARGYDNALALTARIDGYMVSLGGKTAPVTKEVVAAKLAEFSDDELAEMGLSRKKVKK
jgi:hypothetical protein